MGRSRSPHSEEELHGQLVEPLVAVSGAAHVLEIERCLFEFSSGIRLELHAGSRVGPAPSELFQQTLNLSVGFEALRLLLEDEIRAHAACREVPHTLLIFGAVGVTVEVTHAGPLRIL